MAAEAHPPPDGRLLDAGGTRIHVHVLGQPAGAAPDLVAIHGASGSTRDWTFRLAAHLTDRYRLILVDRPGLGHSGWPPGGAEMLSVQAELLDAAVAQVGVERALLLGHSYGAAVALSWAQRLPERVAGLVLSSGASMPWPGRLSPWYPIAGSDLGGAIVVPLVAALAPERLARSAMVRIFAPQPVPEGYGAHIGLRMALRASQLRANARQVWRLRPQLVEMSRLYPELALPVEMLHGTADTIVPAWIHSRPASELIPGARLTMLEGIGHMPHHAVPEAVAAAVDRAAVRAGLR